MNFAKGKCDRTLSQLVVVDVQHQLCEAMPADRLEQVLNHTTLLVRAAGLLEIPLLLTEQYPQGLGPTHARLSAVLPTATRPLIKTTFSCAALPAFLETVSQHPDRRQLILVGMETHVCVLQTALDLFALDFEVFVVEDAVSSRAHANRVNALRRLEQAGVKITSAESLVFEWLSDAQHPQFKTLLACLR